VTRCSEKPMSPLLFLPALNRLSITGHRADKNSEES